MIIRGTNPVELMFGKAEEEKETLSAFSQQYEVIEELQLEGFKLGTIVCEITRPRGSELIPGYFGVIVRYDRFSEKPLIIEFVNKLGEFKFSKEELLIIYQALPYNDHRVLIQQQRNFKCNTVDL